MHSQESETEQVVRGVISRVTFHNPSNGYSVLQLSVAENSDQLTVVGTFYDARVGSNILIRGNYIVHPKFGRQLSANSITEIEPETPEAILKYLSSGVIKGIGPKTAKKIVKEFGADALRTIHQEPSKLAAVPGIGLHKADLIVQKLSTNREIQEIMRFLLEHNVSTKLANRIFERYGNTSVEVLKRDPYILAREMRGIGFLTADTIALNIGLTPDSPQRIRAGLYYSLEQASEEGHCYLNASSLALRARALLKLDDIFDLEPQMQALIQDDSVVREDEAIFLKHLQRAEQFVSRFVAQRIGQVQELLPDALVNQAIVSAAKALNVTFSVDQEEAVRRATRSPIVIITGGPGCGKTTIIRALVSVFTQAEKRVSLAAPTGRAAQRMAQVCSHPASTIHRLLKYDPHKRQFLHGISQPLAADVIIVDEASMLDLMLAKDLFSAIPKNATLVLVGDKDQLPSVGPGRVFADLVAIKEIPIVSLSKLFRRSGESSINEIAQMINSGIVPNIPEPDGNTKADAYFIQKSEPEQASNLIEALFTEQLGKKFNFERHQITILTPSNRGPLGTVELNKKVQSRLNPVENSHVRAEIKLGDTIFRVGDRVCQRVNNYNIHEAGVFNGDVGDIKSIDTNTRSLVVELWDGRFVKYQDSDLGQLSLAYALSVHRSQGSEMPCVILALHESHYNLLERQLLYTAVTRAKQLLVVVGSKKALAIATKRAESKRRATKLKERIQKLIE